MRVVEGRHQRQHAQHCPQPCETRALRDSIFDAPGHAQLPASKGKQHGRHQQGGHGRLRFRMQEQPHIASQRERQNGERQAGMAMLQD